MSYYYHFRKLEPVALATAAIFVILGILPIDNVFSSIEWNVILMIAGRWVSIPIY